VTRSDNRTRATRRLAAALRWGGAVVAAGALAALGLVNATSPAQAAGTPTGYDQMSGTGSTASAITVPWTKGLRNSLNQPITDNTTGELNPNSDRMSDTGEYSFMDDGVLNGSNKDFGAFNKLTFTVSQTQDIGHGGITVSWTGAEPTDEATDSGGFMQIMECYGNAPNGPSPEDCEFGEGAVPPGISNSMAGRVGNLCSSGTLSPTNPTGSMIGGGSPIQGCDPNEPVNETPTHDPCSLNTSTFTNPDCLPGDYSIPFVPENGAEPALYQDQDELTEAFDQFSTNEVNFATTSGDGMGQQQFETLTSAQSGALGCGQPQSDGTPQGCWLVIVPRGIYESNGYDTSHVGTTIGIADNGSPLSAGNWAQRVQVHLDYAPLPNFCPLGGTARESLMEGSQLVTRAVQSWELKLNQDANCALVYHLAETPEQQVTNDFITPIFPNVPANGLAFTTDPVGDDRLRAGESLPTLPKIVYAPVAVMALDFGFHIDQAGPAGAGQQIGFLPTPVKVSPQLVARALTQSYRLDLTNYSPGIGAPGPTWAAKNPLDVSQDPQFTTLNPEVIPHAGNSNSIAPLDTVDHSAYYQQIWQWLQGDSTTDGWLNGTSKTAVTIDPSYKSEHLGKAPAIDSMPRSYPCEEITPPGTTGESRCSTDMLPYVTNFDAASADVLAGNPLTYGTTWDPTALAPNNTQGYWDKNPVEPPGQVWEWAVDATPYTAAYGIVPAELCNDSGSSCLSPTVASVTAAVNDAKPDSDGLLEVNPASPGAGAYPLTEVIYAAVRTDMPHPALTDYANFISFADGQGQTPGQAGGDLPAGYLPLTASLQAQASAAVAKLRSIASGGTGSTGTPTTSGSSPSTSTPTSGGPSTGAPATGSSTQPAGASTSTPNPTSGASAAPVVSASGATPTGPVIVPPTIALAAGTTPSQPVGPIRQVLVVVVIVGVAGAGGGILLRRGRLPRWPGRSRP
jgi:hypothetical protein